MNDPLVACDQPECTRTDHTIGYLRARAEKAEQQRDEAYADLERERPFVEAYREARKREDEAVAALRKWRENFAAYERALCAGRQMDADVFMDAMLELLASSSTPEPDVGVPPK